VVIADIRGRWHLVVSRIFRTFGLAERRPALAHAVMAPLICWSFSSSAADGADGMFGSSTHPDDPVSSSAFAAESNVDAPVPGTSAQIWTIWTPRQSILPLSQATGFAENAAGMTGTLEISNNAAERARRARRRGLHPC
jgi:hypothetical protein